MGLAELTQAARRASRREGSWALALLLLASLPDLTTMVPDFNLDVGSLTIHPLDVVAAVLVVTGAIRLVSRPRVGLVAGALVAVWLPLLIGAAWGASDFGFQVAVNASRSMFYGLAVLTYALATRRDWARCDLLAVVPATMVLLVCCVLRIAQDGVLLRGGVEEDTTRFDQRPVTASGALLLLMVAILLLTSSRRVERWQWTGAAGLIVLLVVVQQRTVWFCVPVCVVVWLVSSWQSTRGGATGGGDGPEVSRRTLGVLAGAMLAVGVAIVAIPALRRSATDGGTFRWRVHQWQDGLASLADPFHWLIGVPRGSLRRFWGTTQADGSEYYKPPTGLTTHSFYVDTLLYVGVIGLIGVLILLLVSASWRRRHSWVTQAGMLTLVSAVLVYGVTYFLPTFAFFVVGMGLWGTANRKLPR